MQMFRSRPISIQEIKDMEERQELDLSPEFQRRDVWTDKARSFLLDTIIRGKPIPQIYIRTVENPSTGKRLHQVIDGQQRLTTVLGFLKDGFKVNKVHNSTLGGKRFSELDASIKREILYYEFTCDFLLDAPDPEVWDIFARLNKYPVKINDQELRNSQFYGEFKSIVYSTARDFNTFWFKNGIFSAKQIARMNEAEFVSELFIAISSGIKAKNKATIDGAYLKWDELFPSRNVLVKNFTSTMDLLGAILEGMPSDSNFRGVTLFYSLFCSIYHMQYGLPGFKSKRMKIRQVDVPKIIIALDKIDALCAIPKTELINLSKSDQGFRQAFDLHTIHASNRTIRAEYITSLINTAIKG